MSNIEWTEQTWNPVVGCSIVSPGCTNCYAMGQAARNIRCAAGSGRETHYAGTVRAVKGKPIWTGKLALAPDHILLKPLRWKAPRKIFVNSMGDLFHEGVPDAWIDRVFAVMALAPQHTFQVLTKRSARMRAYCREPKNITRIIPEALDLCKTDDAQRQLARDFCWPLPNIWLGVSAEDQARADERVPDLLATPAAIRFVSAEPLLGAIDFGRLQEGLPNNAWLTWLDKLDWIIVGGESGRGARHMEDAWAENVIAQCTDAGTAVFVKQMGGAVKARMRPIPTHLMVRQFPEVR